MAISQAERDKRRAYKAERREANKAEADAWEASKKEKRREDKSHRAGLENQGRMAGIERTVGRAIYAPVDPGERYSPPPETVVLAPKPVAVPPPQPIFTLISHELPPRPTVPDAPMTFMFTKPAIGSLMVMERGRLMMAISFQPGDHPDLSRAWTVPRWSNLTLRAHTGRGTVESGQSVGTQLLPVIPPGQYSQPGDSFWDGMRKGFEWAAPEIMEAWERWFGIDGNVF